MQTTQASQELHLQNGTCEQSHPPLKSHVVPPLLMLVVSLATGCGLAEEPGSNWEPENQLQEVEADNGLSVNGLSVNGLSVNGLSVNGLSVNGLSSTSFQSWFQGNTAQTDTVMRYLVLCAAPEGQTLVYTDPNTGKTYTWGGELGLAPGWASGLPATVAEQQVVSACLAAHVNKYGAHISISVLGATGEGKTIPYNSLELSTHSRREACLFGNLFSGQGIYVGNDGGALTDSQSSTRACTLGGLGTSRGTDCGPLVQVGTCDTYCTLDSSGTYYTSCTYNGVTYQPLTTRLSPQDIYECGDGICQLTESCGTSNKYNSCQADCGSCN
ncbi:hypothetical protein [Hyalangium versicolor]|uniref:hypothetical protein n=1 Tax=Hyalangium versicolor TaxID=2861190 RepID=UPI001CCADB72|nr:hypothetical protein [Hyalangium versicolor]